jgi:hypothetical protein
VNFRYAVVYEPKIGSDTSGGGCDAGFGIAGLTLFALGSTLAVKRGKPQN